MGISIPRNARVTDSLFYDAEGVAAITRSVIHVVALLAVGDDAIAASCIGTIRIATIAVHDIAVVTGLARIPPAVAAAHGTDEGVYLRLHHHVGERDRPGPRHAAEVERGQFGKDCDAIVLLYQPAQRFNTAGFVIEMPAFGAGLSEFTEVDDLRAETMPFLQQP